MFETLSIAPAALALALGSGIGYGCSGLVNKRVANAASPLTVMALMFLACTVVGAISYGFAPSGQITAAYWLPFLASVVANSCSNLCYLAAIRCTPVSLIGASSGLLPVFAALMAWMILGEVLTLPQFTGILLSFIGLIITYIPPKAPAARHHDYFAYFKHRGAWLMLGATLGWAIAMPFDKQAAQAASVSLHILLVYLALFLVSALFLLLRREPLWRHLSRPQFLTISFAGLLRGIAYNCHLAAIVLAPIGVTELVRRVATPLVSLIGGRLIFNETITPLKLLGTLIVLAALPLVIFK